MIYIMLLLPTKKEGLGDPRLKALSLRPRWQHWERHETTSDLSLLIAKKKNYWARKLNSVERGNTYSAHDLGALAVCEAVKHKGEDTNATSTILKQYIT
jgi:hypothetical protein